MGFLVMLLGNAAKTHWGFRLIIPTSLMHVVPAKAGIHLWCGMVVMPNMDPRLRGDDNLWLWTQAGREFPDLRVMIRPGNVGSGEQLSTRPNDSKQIQLFKYNPCLIYNPSVLW